MLGLNSLKRSMRTEDDAVERDYRTHEAELYSVNPQASEPKKAEELMDIMAARDVIVQHPSAPQAVPTAVTPPQQEQKSLAQKLAPALIALAVSSVPALGSLYGVYQIVKGVVPAEKVEPTVEPPAPPVQPTPDREDGSLDLLPPTR